MKTVAEVCRLTGVSPRTLRHYHAIGLLPPTDRTEGGYRLYDDAAVDRLYLILLFRELGFPLQKIRQILSDPEFDRNRALDDQIALMEEQSLQLRHRMDFARAMKTTGGDHMDFTAFDRKTMDDYAAQAKTLWGKTEAYAEYAQKHSRRSAQEENAVADGLMALFAQLGAMEDRDPAGAAAQQWVARLQDYLTAHYYTCTKPILSSLGQAYGAEGSMRDNIDAAGGEGTGKLAMEAIAIYCRA